MKKKKENTNAEKNFTPVKLFSNLNFLLKRMFKYELLIAPIDLFSIVITTIATFFGPYLLKMIIAELSIEGFVYRDIFLKVIYFCLAMMILEVIQAFLNQMSWWRAVRLRTKMIIEKNEKVLRMDYQTFEHPDTQNMIEKASNALNSNWVGFEGMYKHLYSISRSLFAIVVAVISIITVGPWIIIITLLLLITKFLAQNHVNKIDKKKFWDIMPPYRRKLQYVNNISRNKDVAKDLRIYNMKDFIENEQNDIQETVHQYLRKSQNRKLKLESFLQILMIIQEGALYGFLIAEAINGNIQIDEFTFMLAAVRIFASNLSRLFSSYSDLLNCSRQVTDLRTLLDFENDKDKVQNFVPECDDYQIEFKNVYYRYYEQEGYALENISFTINPKEKIALVGYNGAGKTTLIKLLCGLYHPEQGEILVNGVNINQYSTESYYHLFAPVFQDINCFAFDVAENVSMKYQGQVDYEKAAEALMLAGLDAKINSLPKGIKTTLLKALDEEGTELSGGELQKLALARAIYKNAPIVILDEPTSALDAMAEYDMYMNFNKIVNCHSAVYISHRLSSTRFCDRILMMKDGKIIEEGTHQDLMSFNSEYKRVFDIQAQYYQDEVKQDD